MNPSEATPEHGTANSGVHVDLFNQLQVSEKQREKLEQELNVLRERFDYVMKATQDAVWDWDLSKNTGWYSEGLEKLFGYDPARIGDGVAFWYNTIHPDDRERVVAGIHAVIDNGGKNWHDRYRFKRADGSYAWVLDRGYAIHDTTGKATRMVGSMQDITSQGESEERLRLVIDAAQIGTWDFNPRTGELIWDDRCKALFGMAPSDLVNYDIFLQGVHPDDRQKADEANRNAINGIGNGEYDLEYRTVGVRDQQLRWVRAKGRSYKDENGLPIRYAGTVIDITEEKKQEQRLREEEERFRLLATTIPQIVWTTDEHGIVNYISDKWQAYTGHTPTYDKFSFRELMHPDDEKRVVADWHEHRKKKTPYHVEYRLKNIHTNEYRWYRCTIAPLSDYNGNVTRWIGSATDVHDQKMIAIYLENKVAERTQALQTLNEKLEKSNYELEQYAYVTSHDLKEPLRKIQLFTNLITSQYTSQLDTRVIQYLTKIESASARMSGLIDSLLRYSKLSKGALLLEPVDLTIVVKNVMEEFEYSLAQKNITVDVALLPVLNAVPIQMHQLFSNLFSNAIKFSKPDTANKITITSSTLSTEETAQHPTLKATDKHFKIVFQDEGIGFLPEYSEQVFTIFQRLNSQHHVEGHGIGLALCRKIVSNHNGLIWATGEENKGAVFTMIFPDTLVTTP